MTGVGDLRRSGNVAFRVDAAMFGDRGDIVRELLEIEYANFVPVRCTVKCHGGAAGTGAQYGDLH